MLPTSTPVAGNIRGDAPAAIRPIDERTEFSHLPTTSSISVLFPSTTRSVIMDDDVLPEFACVDIKEYLWQNSSDLTSLPSTMSVFAFIYAVIITLGVVGNSLVILSITRHKSLQSVRNMFILSLSCSDIVVSFVSGTVTPISAFTKVWLFGAALCKLVPVIQGASLCFSTLTLTAISIDRFILIIYPTKRSIQKRQAFQMIALNCAIATCISAPMFFKQILVDFGNFCGQFCAEDWGNDQSGRSTYGTLVFVLQFVIPFFVITFCYLMISLKLSKGMMINSSKHQPLKLSIQQSEQRRQALKRRLRTNRMLMAMVGVFLCCWTPSVVFNFLRDYQWLPSFIMGQEYLYGIITHCISMSSTVWNPVLYALLNEHFRLAFVELLHRFRHRWLSGDSPSGSVRSFMADQLNNRAHRCSRLISNAFLLDTIAPKSMQQNNHTNNIHHQRINDESIITASVILTPTIVNNNSQNLSNYSPTMERSDENGGNADSESHRNLIGATSLSSTASETVPAITNSIGDSAPLLVQENGTNGTIDWQRPNTISNSSIGQNSPSNAGKNLVQLKLDDEECSDNDDEV
ncbi:7 transmembrane receptor (rhodopsin family) domain-containing protein [Ditylenchus destructor]|nr:7 transmembrane receptor (rhodopsin family) domain-containing protein [Ditylenchus destructor]